MFPQPDQIQLDENRFREPDNDTTKTSRTPSNYTCDPGGIGFIARCGKLAMFFAHSNNGQDPTTWQLLREHLLAVSQLTSLRAGKFGAGRLGALIGLLHDLGKYALAFQNYINGRGASPDHATAGACEIQALTAANGGDRLWAMIGAYCIAGHHSGLPNWHGERSLFDRLKKQLPALDPAWRHELAPQASELLPKDFKPPMIRACALFNSQCSGGCCSPVWSTPTSATPKASMRNIRARSPTAIGPPLRPHRWLHRSLRCAHRRLGGRCRR